MCFISSYGCFICSGGVPPGMCSPGGTLPLKSIPGGACTTGEHIPSDTRTTGELIPGGTRNISEAQLLI